MNMYMYDKIITIEGNEKYVNVYPFFFLVGEHRTFEK